MKQMKVKSKGKIDKVGVTEDTLIYWQRRNSALCALFEQGHILKPGGGESGEARIEERIRWDKGFKVKLRALEEEVARGHKRKISN